MKKPHEINMTRGAMFPELLQFILPLMASSLLQLAFNAADLIVVGRFGRPNAMAAVGSSGALVNLVVNVLMGLSVGGGVLCARFFGAGEKDRLRRTVSTTLMVGLCGGVLFGILGATLTPPLLQVNNTPPEVLPLASLYLRIYFLGMPVFALYNFSSAGLRAMGDTKRPLLFLSIAGVLNVAMNLFFVIVLGIDVAGVAIATVLSQCVSCFLTVRCLLRAVELTLPRLRFSPRAFTQIVRIGLPAGIQGSLFSVSNFIIQGAVNSFGAAVVAGVAACMNLGSFVYTGEDAASQAASTAISQNLGAGEYGRARRAMVYCMTLVAGLTTLLSGTILLLRGPLLRLYISEEAAFRAAYTYMFITMTTHVFNGTMAVMTGVNRGLGYGVLPAAVTLIGVCVFRIVWIATVFAAHRTLETLLISYPISWVLTTAALLVCYFLVRKKAFLRAAPEQTDPTGQKDGQLVSREV